MYKQMLAALAVSLLAVALASARALTPRQTEIWESPFAGTILAPATDDTITPETPFAFSYARNNWCESAFSPFTVYLAMGDAPPMFTDVTVNGTLANGTYALEFGKFTVSNFGLPLPEGSVAPPSDLTVPAGLVETGEGAAQAYVTVLQEFDGCPGHIAVEYSLASVPVMLGVDA